MDHDWLAVKPTIERGWPAGADVCSPVRPVRVHDHVHTCIRSCTLVWPHILYGQYVGRVAVSLYPAEVTCNDLFSLMYVQWVRTLFMSVDIIKNICIIF